MNQVKTVERVFLTLLLSVSTSDGESASKNWQSSAYETSLQFGKCCGRSEVKMINKNGPKIDPWTIP